MDGLARLSSLRMICKAASCDKRLCMIDVGHVAIGHVSGSDQVGRVLHEVINICILGERLRESCTLCRESEVCWREPCVELLKSVSSIGCGATIKTGVHVWRRVW